MLHAVHALFRPGTKASRDALEETTSANLEQPFLTIHLAGPLLDKDGNRSGILMIMEADDIETVRTFVANSRYQKAGIYETVRIDRFAPEVGKI